MRSRLSGYNKGDVNMIWKRQICPRCKTGKESYELDRRSDACPYINCCKKGKCIFLCHLINHQKQVYLKEINQVNHLKNLKYL